VAAVLVVAAWLVLLGWLVLHADATPEIWARWLTVLSSLEAVSFAAAGTLFGTVIQRQRVAAAERRADKAEGEANANSAAAANGRALASAVKARGRRTRAASGLGVERMAAPTDVVDDELTTLANELFPD
jgi:hypothetical protein